MSDDWTVRADDGVALADVRSYTRMRDGRPEQVRNYSRMGWWVPHPDWAQGQQRWVTAGEAEWTKRSEEARAHLRNEEPHPHHLSNKPAKAPGQRPGPPSDETLRKTRERADDTTQSARSAEEGIQDRGPHNYLTPDPERLVNQKGANKSPADHPFFQRNPVDPANVVKAFDGATASERGQGMRWVEDLHRLAWAIGGGDAELGAKMLAAYSAHADWPSGMFNAARSLAEGRPLTPADGLVSKQHGKAAEAVLGGAGIDEAFSSPEVAALTRLIALGGDHPQDELGQVPVDLHALSAAAGKRLGPEDTAGKGEFKAPLGDPRMHEYVADTFRNAARQVSERDGEEVAPHQVAAVAGLRQKRLNAKEGQARTAAPAPGPLPASGLPRNVELPVQHAAGERVPLAGGEVQDVAGVTAVAHVHAAVRQLPCLGAVVVGEAERRLGPFGC